MAVNNEPEKKQYCDWEYVAGVICCFFFAFFFIVFFVALFYCYWWVTS